MRCGALPALTTLAVLGLAAHPQVACAQSLTLNGTDTVTVNGTGTVGVVGGAPYATNTTSYSDGGNGYAVETNDASNFTLGSGGTLTGGVVVAGLLANGTGATTITGGTIIGGYHGNGLDAAGSGIISISGGTLTGGSGGSGLYQNGSSPISITGGTISGDNAGLLTVYTGIITVSGGTINAGSQGHGLVAEGGSAIDLYGSKFIDPMGISLTPGETESLPSDPNGATGSFFGILENDTTGQTFSYLNYSTITLHDVGLAATPEPSACVGLGIGLLGLGALGMRARRRVA